MWSTSSTLHLTVKLPIDEVHQFNADNLGPPLIVDRVLPGGRRNSVTDAFVDAFEQVIPRPMATDLDPTAAAICQQFMLAGRPLSTR